MRDRERREARRRAIWLRSAISCVSALALVAALVGGYSVRQHQQAARSTSSVESTQLAAASAVVDAADPGEAAQLAAAAYRDTPTEEAASALYSVIGTPLDRVVDGFGATVLAVAAEPDGPLAAAIGERTGGYSRLRIYDLANPAAPVIAATVRATHPAGLAFVPGRAPGRAILAGPCGLPVTGLCLWSLASPRRPAVIARLPLPAGLSGQGFSSLAVSPDGALLAAASQAGRTPVWNMPAARPRLLTELPNPSGTPGISLPAVAFAPRSGPGPRASRAAGGDLLAETNFGGQTRLYRLSAAAGDPALDAMIRAGYTDIAFGPAASPACPLLSAVGGPPGSDTGLWSVASPRHPVPLAGVADRRGQRGFLVQYRAEHRVQPGRHGAPVQHRGRARSGRQAVRDQADRPHRKLNSVDAACSSLDFASYATAFTPAGALLSGGFDGYVRLWRSALPQAAGPTWRPPNGT